MTAALETGLLTATGLPAGQRTYYEQVLLDVLRTKSILSPFCIMKEDFAARDTGRMSYTEVLDTEPNWNAVAESAVWLTGAHLDSRAITIDLEIHGDVIKLSDYNELTNFWNSGDFRSLCQGKLGQNMVDTMDILARNAFLSHPNKSFGACSSRADIAATNVFDPDMAELIRTHLEENEVPGVAAVSDGEVGTIVCVTTPRVIHDIRVTAASKWLEVNDYNSTGRKFTGEVGMWGGVRFIRTNRLRLRNAGTVTTQTTLTGATVAGQGAAATVDTVYSVGQTGSTRTIPVTSETGFVVGQYVTIHDATLGAVVLDTDGTQETRRIVACGTGTLSFDKPLLKAHASGAYVTKAVDIHASVFMGGPGVVYGVGERPAPVPLPVIDDLGMIRRLAWRGFFKYQLFRPEMFEVVETGGTVN
jgi:N4-gp56 family major capsid protein